MLTTWYPETQSQYNVNIGGPQNLLLVVDLHADVVGGVDHQVGHEDVEEVGGDAGPGDGAVDEERKVEKLQHDDQHNLRDGKVLPPDLPAVLGTQILHPIRHFEQTPEVEFEMFGSLNMACYWWWWGKWRGKFTSSLSLSS